MKHLSFFLAITLLSFVGLAQQNKPKIYVDKFFNKEEQVMNRTFSIINLDAEKTKENLVKSMGTPIKQSLGSIEWENVSIEGIGTNIHVALQDGIFTKSKTEVSYMIFGDRASKIKALQNLSDTKFRSIRIRFIDENRKLDAIKDKKDEEEVLKWIEEKLAN